jgi:hypothetical protein
MKTEFIKNQIGQIGVITTLDSAALWTVTGVHELGLIVHSCDNPKQWRSVKAEFFWVLVDSL